MRISQLHIPEHCRCDLLLAAAFFSPAIATIRRNVRNLAMQCTGSRHRRNLERELSTFDDFESEKFSSLPCRRSGATSLARRRRQEKVMSRCPRLEWSQGPVAGPCGSPNNRNLASQHVRFPQTIPQGSASRIFSGCVERYVGRGK